MTVAIPRSLGLDSVQSGARTFNFRQTLEVDVANEDGVWALTHEASGLNSYGETLDEALERFAEDVAYAWDAYAAKPDTELGTLALKAKRSLLEIVSQVTS